MKPNGFSGFFIAAACGTGLLLTACNQTGPGDVPEIHELVYGRVDSVRFWPPDLRYARTGDTLVLIAHNYSRVHLCALPLEKGEGGWNFSFDASAEYYRFRVAVYSKPVDAECPPDPGTDSSFRRIFSTAAGRTLYLQDPSSNLNDSVYFVGDSTALHVFNHVRTDAEDTLSTHARFVFRDSTAGHPQRAVYADSLNTCEILQAGSFERNGDTLAVQLRTLLADSLAVDVPACNGPYSDTLEILPRLYRFP